MGSKTETKTQSTQTRDPYSPAIPNVNAGTQGSLDWYKSNVGTEYYPYETFVPMSDTTATALGAIQDKVLNGNELTSAAQGAAMDYINGGFEGPANDFYRAGMAGDYNLNPAVFDQFMNANNPGTARLANMSNAPYSAGTNEIAAKYDQFQGGSNNPSNNYYNDIAAGNNPYLDKTFDHVSGKISDAVNSNFSKAGRYGSAAHQGKLTEDLGQFANDFYGSQYNADQNRRMSAAGALSNDYYQNLGINFNAINSQAGLKENELGRQFSADQSDRSRELQKAQLESSNYANDRNLAFNAANAKTGVDANNFANMYGAANALTQDYNNMDAKQLQAIQMAQGLNNADYQDFDRLLRVGAAYEGYDKQYVNDAFNRWMWEQMAPGQKEQLFAGITGTYGSLGGTQNYNGTTTQSQSGLGPAIGNVMGGIGTIMPFLPQGSPGMIATQPGTSPTQLAQGVNNGAYGYQNGQYWS